MKYPCELIRDLLPLYIDGVSSDKSNMVIEEHLKECISCRCYLESLTTQKDVDITYVDENSIEKEKRNSFLSIKRKIRKKQFIVSCVACVSLLMIIIFSVGILKEYRQVVEYKDNVSVSMVDGSLVGRLQGNRASYFSVKRIEREINGQGSVYLFFYIESTKWDDLMTSDDVYSEIMICPDDKGANSVDGVYYYTGDYSGLEMLDDTGLAAVFNESVLLWSK